MGCGEVLDPLVPEKAKEIVNDTVDTVREGVKSAGDTIKDIYQDPIDDLRELYDDAEDAMKRGGARAEDWLKEFGEDTQDSFDRIFKPESGKGDKGTGTDPDLPGVGDNAKKRIMKLRREKSRTVFTSPLGATAKAKIAQHILTGQ